jgi:hypothetical protein
MMIHHSSGTEQRALPRTAALLGSRALGMNLAATLLRPPAAVVEFGR